MSVQPSPYVVGTWRVRARVAFSSYAGLSFRIRALKHGVVQLFVLTHRPLSSSFLGLPYRILNINHKKELFGGAMG